MSKNRHADELLNVRVAAILPADRRAGVQVSTAEPDGQPHVRAKVIERTMLVRFVNADFFFEESAVRALGDELERLIEEEGHTRLLLNFAGVQHLSCAALGRLVVLQRKLAPARGGIRLCGLNPLLQDMLRLTRLDRVFDVYTDEAEALGLIVG
jgi:anti-sigma B factor antagonist